MTRVVRRVVQDGRISEACAEDKEGADHQGKDARGQTIAEGERNARNCRRSHDNLRDGKGMIRVGHCARIDWQVSWLAASGIAPGIRLAFPGQDRSLAVPFPVAFSGSLRNGKFTPLYSRGVGHDWDAQLGSIRHVPVYSRNAFAFREPTDQR
jgi:hypothetical protein